MLVFFAFCGVAALHSLSHIQKYAPSLVRRAPCKIQKILRLVLIRFQKEPVVKDRENGNHLLIFKASNRAVYKGTQVIR